MTNSVPEATKQLPTLLSVVTLETTAQTQTAIKTHAHNNNSNNDVDDDDEEQPPGSHNTSTSLITLWDLLLSMI